MGRMGGAVCEKKRRGRGMLSHTKAKRKPSLRTPPRQTHLGAVRRVSRRREIRALRGLSCRLLLICCIVWRALRLQLRGTALVGNGVRRLRPGEVHRGRGALSL